MGFDVSNNNRLTQKVYEYLIQEGLIVFRYNGGGLSISHEGIKRVQEELESPGEILPNKVVDELIDSLEELNVLSKNKLGSRIFNPSPKELNNLRNINNSEEGFIATILRIASIINSVYYDEIKKQIKKEPEPGSINLISELFVEKNLNYSLENIQTLRLLHRLRSTKQPIHNAEHKAIDVLKSLGINYPPNWERAGQTCLYNLLTSVKNLKEALIKY